MTIDRRYFLNTVFESSSFSANDCICLQSEFENFYFAQSLRFFSKCFEICSVLSTVLEISTFGRFLQETARKQRRKTFGQRG